MNFYYFMRLRFSNYAKQFYCYCTYGVAASLLFILSQYTKTQPVIFQLILFFWGWLTWTFIEYISHRFWMHSKGRMKQNKDFANHQYHHSHPTEIKISATHRVLMLIGLITMIFVSTFVNNYLFVVTGIYSGFVCYTFMHVILHEKWSAKVFRRLHEYHIYHHCKYPNRCFGVSVVWWDVIFGTTPPAHAKLSQRIIDFYFGKGM
jgi:sterol desaturase/sphingolipid hydroxylase (fatty acid hydroxylase superfamily)